MVHTYSRMCLFPLNAHQLNPPTMVSRCYNPCLSFVCTLLYTGSSVLQINESPVCSLDKVPQALACDWLLACLQVTFPFCNLHQSTTSSMLLVLLIKQTGVFFSLRNVFFLAVISNHAWLMALQLFLTCFFVCFVIGQFPQDHVNHFKHFLYFFFLISHFCHWFVAAFNEHFRPLIIFKLFPHSLKHTRTFKPVAVQLVVQLLGDHMGRQMASYRAAQPLNERIRSNQY